MLAPVNTLTRMLLNVIFLTAACLLTRISCSELVEYSTGGGTLRPILLSRLSTHDKNLGETRRGRPVFPFRIVDAEDDGEPEAVNKSPTVMRLPKLYNIIRINDGKRLPSFFNGRHNNVKRQLKDASIGFPKTEARNMLRALINLRRY